MFLQADHPVETLHLVFAHGAVTKCGGLGCEMVVVSGVGSFRFVRFVFIVVGLISMGGDGARVGAIFSVSTAASTQFTLVFLDRAEVANNTFSQVFLSEDQDDVILAA